MIGYVTLGTNDLPRAAAFYDALLAEIGATRLMDYGRGYSYGASMDKPTLGIVKPYDTKPATVGNGVMVALGVDSRATVDRVYRKALELGVPTKDRPVRAATISTPATSAIWTATSSAFSAWVERQGRAVARDARPQCTPEPPVRACASPANKTAQSTGS